MDIWKQKTKKNHNMTTTLIDRYCWARPQTLTKQLRIIYCVIYNLIVRIKTNKKKKKKKYKIALFERNRNHALWYKRISYDIMEPNAVKQRPYSDLVLTIPRFSYITRETAQYAV